MVQRDGERGRERERDEGKQREHGIGKWYTEKDRQREGNRERMAQVSGTERDREGDRGRETERG